MSASAVRCRWCAQRHKPRFLCDPAQKILLALYAKGMEGNMPSIEFPEPIPADKLASQLGLNPGDRLLSQLVVKAAIVPVADVPRPALLFTGRDSSGGVLPQWFYVGDESDMARTVALVSDMANLAVRRATT